MGMFDHITVRCDMPSWMKDVSEWQTKDFDCQLEECIICENGSLVKIVMGKEHGDVWLPQKLHNLNYNGYVLFYGFDQNQKFIEVKATFEDRFLAKFEKVKR